MPLRDRTMAGRLLAESCALASIDAPVVVTLPRGAVSVAVEVAAKLGAAIDVMPVEELSTPGKPEYVVGAVAENAIHVIDSEALAALGVTEDSLAIRVAEATAMVARMTPFYRGDTGHSLDITHRHVVVVDDGCATVPALEAVAVALARHNVDSLILATPFMPEHAPQGYERVVTAKFTDETHESLTLVGGVPYDEQSSPSHEVAGQMLRDFVAARAN
jgi:putative phosphoribosyl transferase